MGVNRGMISVPYYEWWLHNHPFKREVHTCPICSSDTGCWKDCPAKEIERLLYQAGDLVRDFYKKRDTSGK